MAEPAIEAKGLLKCFGEGDARTVAVRDASFVAVFGEMLFIVGPSGSGKTTLLSMISGVLRPDGGEVVVEGQDVWKMRDNALADFRLHRVGFVFQDFHLFPKLTTEENVAIPMILQRVPWNAALERARQDLEIVGLTPRAHLKPNKLSGGEQQRVAIARAIATRPDILIFDEPTASLDGDTGMKIMAFVKTELLTAKRAILVVTHDDRIFEFADRIMHMEDGHITRTEVRHA